MGKTFWPDQMNQTACTLKIATWFWADTAQCAHTVCHIRPKSAAAEAAMWSSHRQENRWVFVRAGLNSICEMEPRGISCDEPLSICVGRVEQHVKRSGRVFFASIFKNKQHERFRFPVINFQSNNVSEWWLLKCNCLECCKSFETQILNQLW